MRKDVAFGLDGPSHEPFREEIAVDQHFGIAQGDEVLGDEGVEHDFDVAATFEQAQGHIVAQRFDFNFEQAGARREG